MSQVGWVKVCHCANNASGNPMKSLCVKGKAENHWKLNASDLWSFRRHCIKNWYVSVMDLTTWAPEYFEKLSSINILSCCIRKCKLGLYHAQHKSQRNISTMSRNTSDFSGLGIICNGLMLSGSILSSDKPTFQVVYGNNAFIFRNGDVLISMRWA